MSASSSAPRRPTLADEAREEAERAVGLREATRRLCEMIREPVTEHELACLKRRRELKNMGVDTWGMTDAAIERTMTGHAN